MKGHIRQRGERIFALIVELERNPATGRRRQKQRTFHGSKREAQAALTSWIDQVNKGSYIEPSKLTLGAYLDEWLASYGKTQLRTSTYESYEQKIRCHIKPALGDTRLARLTPTQVQKFYAALLEGGRKDGRQGGLAPRTIEYIHTILWEALDHAVAWEYLAKNPATKVKPPQYDRKRFGVWTPADAEAMLRYLTSPGARRMSPHWYAFYCLALLAGLRKGELLGLRWADVDIERGVVHITQSLQRTKAKGLTLEAVKTDASYAAVDIGSMVTEALRKHKVAQARQRIYAKPGEREDSDLVFTTAGGKPIAPRYANKNLQRVIRNAGLPLIRFHDLRHSHATQLLIAGVHPKVVQERLRHKEIATTMDIYSHVVPTLGRAAADKAEALVFGATNSGTEGWQTEGKRRKSR